MNNSHAGVGQDSATAVRPRWLQVVINARRSLMSNRLSRFKPAPPQRAARRARRALRRRCGARRCPRRRAGARDAQEPGDDQHRRRRRQSRADAGRDRALSARSIRKLVAKINFTKAPAPELPGKLKAMQGAGRSDIDLVLTGTDFLAAGIEQGVLMKLLADLRGEVPEPDRELSAGGGEDAGARAGLRRRGRVHAGRPAASNTTRTRSSRCRRRRPSCSRGARRIRTG